MASKTTEETTTIEFQTSGLFRATGFENGELLKPYFPLLSPAELRDLLAVVVERHVLPKLDQRVGVMILPSARNPVRATSVDKESVVWTTADAGSGPKVTPAVVNVDLKQAQDCLPKQKTNS